MSDESDWENEDILSKLKRHLDSWDINYYAGDMLHDAVDEIETLRAENNFKNEFIREQKDTIELLLEQLDGEDY